MLIMTGFCWYGSISKKNCLSWANLAALTFGIVFGVRYDVGVDFPAYFEVYQTTKFGFESIELERWEPGFQILYFIASKLSLHYSILFGFIAFTQIFLIFYGLKEINKVWIFIPLTLICLSQFQLFLNGMRQLFAFSILVFSIPFLVKRQILKYVISIIIASLFHLTAIILILIPILYIKRKELFKNIYLEIGLFFISLLIMNINLTESLYENLEGLSILFGYDNYLDSSFAEFNEDINTGLGFMISIIINFIIILKSKEIKLSFKSCPIQYNLVNVLYDLYFIGVFLNFAFARLFLIKRINYYFYTFEFVMLAIALWVFFKKNRIILFSTFMALLTVLFLGQIRQIEGTPHEYKTFFYPEEIQIG